ncbi:MAG: o-succinylbenzoate---CoA ligase [Solirubrobacteraceae bacterium]|jgi:O-succinylbenzoic acid--CoA ligase|nr:o-succinylbenzoate---CoA ligase [Solirubrobacteraceae bacterium]
MRVPPWLERAAALHPDRAAVETPDGCLTYDELELASRIRYPAGERIAIALPAGLDFAVALHACLRCGAVAVPVDLRLAPAERARVCEGAAVVVEDAVLGSTGSHGSASADDPGSSGSAFAHDLEATAAVIHSSGTTGTPKAIELTYGNWLWSALGSATAIGLDPAERWLCTLPLAHVGGLSILIRSAIYATTAVLHERFETQAVLGALVEDAITVVSLVPTTLARLLDAGLESPPALRCALIGGAPASPALLARARAAGVVTVATYGLTEACSQVTTQIPGDRGDDAGVALFCTRVRIEDGEIQVAGPTVCPQATRRVGDGGWLSTGDLGDLVDGRLLVTGRRSELILTGGENVSPVEIEAVLTEHPSVREAAVVGYAHPEWGEAIRAVVVLRPGLDPNADELRAHCLARLARFKVPKEFVFLDAIPRTSSGKISRRDLRGP